MSEHTIKMHHITKNIETKMDAFSFGFWEGFGRAAAWAIVIGLFLVSFEHFNPDEESPTEQAE